MTPLRLEDLIEAVARKDAAAFCKLHAHTSVRVSSIALSILRNREDAEEATQEIYVKIWRQAAHFSCSEGTGSEWVGSISRNHSIDVMRGRKPQGVSIDGESDLASSAPTPEELSIAASEGAAIQRSMAMLAPAHADVLRQAYVQGFSHQQLSEIHDVPINTIKTWLRRSLITLRNSMAQ